MTRSREALDKESLEASSSPLLHLVDEELEDDFGVDENPDFHPAPNFLADRKFGRVSGSGENGFGAVGGNHRRSLLPG